jgi:hypothetical protein
LTHPPSSISAAGPWWRRALPTLQWLAVALLYTAVTCAYFWPLPRLWQNHLGPDIGDPLFVLYLLKWGVHQIQLGLPDLWNANIFYPTRGTLAFSEHFLGPAAQLFLFLKIVPSAVAGYNFLFLSSYVASALAVCWMLRRSGLSWTAAVLGGWMYAFSSFRLSQVSHLHILIAQWIPPTLWFWDRLLTRRTVKDAALFLLFYLLNLTGGCYLAYMVHFSLLAIFLSRAAAEGKDLFSFRSLRLLVPVVLVAAVAGAALFLPYARVAREHGLSRSEHEIQVYSAKLTSYVSPSTLSFYFGEGANRFLHRVLGESADLFYRPENSLFAGVLPTVLFLVGAAAAFRRWLRDRNEPVDPWNPWIRGLVLSGLIAFALSFAWAYVPLSKVVPGLSGMRVPARLYVLVSLTVVFFAARGVDLLMRRVHGTRARAALALGFAAILAVELAPRRLDWERLPREDELPKAYTWIRDEPSIKGLVELPLHGDSRENFYLYAATLHWKPIANGYSGYMARSYVELSNRIKFLPNAGGFNLLRRMKISHIVVHARSASRVEALESWEARFADGPRRQVERVYQEKGISIYRVLDRPMPSRMVNSK